MQLGSQRDPGLGSLDNFWRRPTLAWFASDLGLDVDVFFEGLMLVSMGLAAGAVTGFGSLLSFGFLWLAYLTQQSAGQTFLGFQWDILLLEVGVITTLWAPVMPQPFTRTGKRAQPSHTVMWLARFLLFKLMFMSGIVKLQAECPTWQHLSALDYHYATQCIPTAVAWYAHQVCCVLGSKLALFKYHPYLCQSTDCCILFFGGMRPLSRSFPRSSRS